MKKFEYKLVPLSNEILLIRKSDNPRNMEGDEVIILEIINKLGSEGWRFMTPDNVFGNVYFEREINGP